MGTHPGWAYDSHVANPWEWARPSGAVEFYTVLALILVGCALKLFTGQWDDWLDEARGRGSIADWWPWSSPSGEPRS